MRGNYFGTNASGTGKRPLEDGVIVSDTGPNEIGGDKPSAGNYFCCTADKHSAGVMVNDGGNGTVVQNNTFGVRPNGRPANGMPYGVSVQSATAIVRDNTFRNMTSYGVFAQGPTGYAKIFGNTFTGCECAVEITNFARGLLGSLGNKATDDDGGNIFDPSNTMFIQNFTTKAIRAEGNDFGTISKAEINAKIIDREDYPTFSGRVDFTPLAGGVVPTGAILAVTGASAVPVGSGAEIIFTLSTAADVTVSVLNIAGRPVATVARDVTTEGGLQRMVWSGHADGGLAAPAGQYLVRVEAREPSGQRAQILAAMRITR